MAAAAQDEEHMLILGCLSSLYAGVATSRRGGSAPGRRKCKPRQRMEDYCMLYADYFADNPLHEFPNTTSAAASPVRTSAVAALSAPAPTQHSGRRPPAAPCHRSISAPPKKLRQDNRRLPVFLCAHTIDAFCNLDPPFGEHGYGRIRTQPFFFPRHLNPVGAFLLETPRSPITPTIWRFTSPAISCRLDRNNSGGRLDLLAPNNSLANPQRTQDVLKSRLVLQDDFGWSLPSMSSDSDQSDPTAGKLKYIGGVDISFLKEDPSTACAALVVLDAQTLEIVHDEFDIVRMQVPYVPGFLAFREAPILLGLLEKMKTNAQHLYPQLLMVDGNGLLHPRGFGLACHLGVLADLPTIGVGKNLHHVDGLNQSEVRRQLEAKENCNKEYILLTGQSGATWGAAMRSCPGSSKPIYTSVGHRISLDSAIGVVKYCCKYRVPEPTRQADIRSKVYLQQHLRLQQ
ncbi:hypothetical protein QYE76_036372 [Lolium multiflorum]|uniref:Endonuclease V n=1 Tax=Lolium multiflorum TaxID=4521 RepID=A0AAD8R3G8_LOLMU|nr:hypothetical protein QYE76_036372 [Lolium multiflorum]